MVTNCPQPIGYFVIDGQEVPAPCKQWNCPVCGKVKKNKLLDRVARGYKALTEGAGPSQGFNVAVFGGARVRALCLTLGPDAKNELMGKYFARFRAWLAKPRLHHKKYRSFRGINYFWTKEFQENGQLHLHILIDAYIPVQLIRKAWKWATYGTSKIVFITKINREIKRPAGYMTKYMLKELEQADEFRRKERRFGFSRKGGLFKPQVYKSDSLQPVGFIYKPSPVCRELMDHYERKARENPGAMRKDPPGPGASPGQ